MWFATLTASYVPTNRPEGSRKRKTIPFALIRVIRVIRVIRGFCFQNLYAGVLVSTDIANLQSLERGNENTE